MRKIVIVLAIVLGSSSVVFAEGKKGITLEEAIDIASREVPGSVIEAEFEEGFYEIKIKAEGGDRIKLKIDPKDGTIIRKGRIVKGSSKGFSKQK